MKLVIQPLLLTVLCRFYFSQALHKSSPRVFTPSGKIEGYYKTSYNGRKFEAYEGVPYAWPPIGSKRFQVPERITPWKGILLAKKFSSSCVQYFPLPGQEPSGLATGSEDCLYLNIYTAITSKNHSSGGGDLLPVIVFIHGGYFQYGSGKQYGPKYLLDKNLTLVTINYRLGPLGFLSTEDDVVPGNMGLKDQVMALRWVKDNIQSFGGDPSRITIVGHSAGGASVHYHLLSNITSGLFSRAMSISGTALDCWAQTEGSLEKAKKLAAILDCPSRNITTMINCLRTIPAVRIIQAINEFMPFLYNPTTPFGPVIEKGEGNDFKLIDRAPIETMISGKTPQDVPWLLSDVSEEGLINAAEFITRDYRLEELNDKWETIAPHLLDFNYTIPENNHSAMAKLIREHYLGGSEINREVTNELVKMIGDRYFLYNNEKSAKLQAKMNQSPVRFYYFSYRGARSISELYSMSLTNFGVSHTDDVAYVLDSFFNPTTTSEDREIQKLLIDIWSSFAADGVPSVPGVEWSRLSESYDDELRYLHIAGPKEINMEEATNFGNKDFWQTIPFRENNAGE